MSCWKCGKPTPEGVVECDYGCDAPPAAPSLPQYEAQGDAAVTPEQRAETKRLFKALAAHAAATQCKFIAGVHSAEGKQYLVSVVEVGDTPLVAAAGWVQCWAAHKTGGGGSGLFSVLGEIFVCSVKRIIPPAKP